MDVSQEQSVNERIPGALPDHVMSIHIAAPIRRVWDEITKTGRIQRALFDTILECELVPGSRLRYYSADRSRVFVVGEVVAVEAPYRFAHTYMFTTSIEPRTLVTWELREESGGCRVTITHSGWTPANKRPDKVAAGWREILRLLKHEVETGRLPLGSRVLFRVQSWFLFMMPRTTKVEYADEQGW